MATKTENAEIAVLQTQMKQVTDTLDNVQKAQEEHYKVITSKLDALNPIPFTVVSLEARVKSLEKAKSRNWLFNTASAGVGALLFFLIQYAITHPPQ